LFNILKGVSGDKTFKRATVSVLVLMVLFFVGLVVSLLTYIDWNTFLSVLVSEEILFAIRLSVGTAALARYSRWFA
jgi:ABC-type sulfate transport system permease component